jgi:impB/mucB/samB family C-terminal domain
VQACIETVAPLASQPEPAWALSVARPAADGLRLAEKLQHVPRPALQTIFGKSLGRRIWEQARAKAAPALTPPMECVGDAEISVGMVAYLSSQAADALRQSGRHAIGLSMTITYTDGETRLTRARLARPTNEGDEIAKAAVDLWNQISVRAVALASIRLAVSGVELASDREPAKNFEYSMRQAPARA